MGVPSFYRWLVKKYQNIVCDVSEENPNGLEFDNLYLDMNGIIHPCFHPEDNLFDPPTTFEDVFENIYKYIDKLFSIVKPRKLLFLAIDGVAPRAKMNQQRSRRFRTAKDNETCEEIEKKLRKKFEMEGKFVLPKEESELSDSNIVTPGTEFMYLLSKKIQGYIKRQMTNDSSWKTIKVILSDANVPGEGEHKIMSFIRAQRGSEGFNANTRHCLYGLDADLIMLALATHEVHFSILREDVLAQGERVSSSFELERSVNKAEAYSAKCRGWFKQVVGKEESAPESCNTDVALGSEKSTDESKKLDRRSPVMKTPFQFLNVWLLREYIDIDVHISDPPEDVKIELERIIDDFIFICFFTGNDFLPHMPTLEIHEDAIDLIIHVYKKEFKNLGGYLVDTQRIGDKKGGYIKLKRVEKFILAVGEYEEKIFKKRSEIQDKKIRRMLSQQSQAEDAKDEEFVLMNLQSSSGSTDDAFCAEKASAIVCPSSVFDQKENTISYSDLLNNTKELKQKIKDHIRYQSDTYRYGSIPADQVKLGSPRFKERYYDVKFSAKSPGEMECTRKALVTKYTEGLCWVLKYYFSGVPSWTWFYPFHYGPFASDLKGVTQVNVKFQKGLPLKPFDQLLAVLPPRSANALPEVYKKLMVDEDSCIADFYPKSFQLDTDGKRFLWQAICKVPFIQEDRLLAETRKVKKELKGHEKVRNAETTGDRLFVSRSSCLGEHISAVYKNQPTLIQNHSIKINSVPSHDVSGIIHLCEENDQEVYCLFYKLPEDCVHIHHLLGGVIIPDKTITEADIVTTQLWHESWGNTHTRAIMTNQNNNRRVFPKNKEPESIYKGAGVGWGKGRGKVDSSCLQTWQGGRGMESSYDQFVESKFSSTSTTAGSLNLRPEKQCKDEAWGSTHPRVTVINPNHNMKFCPKNKEPELIQEGAGAGWSRGRGKVNDSTLQTGQRGVLKSYAHALGSNNISSSSPSTYSKTASNLNLRMEKQCTLPSSGNGWNRWQNTGEGSWRNSLTNNSSSSSAWRHSQPTSALPGQQSQYVPKTSTSSWNTRDRH